MPDVSSTPQPSVQRDLVYAVHDGVELRADLHQPAGDGPFPAMVLIHGGGWVAGSRGTLARWADFLAESGYVAFNISYRLATAGQPSYQQNLWDCKSAVQYLRGRARELRVNPARIGGIGHSAGGHLVSMLALTANEPLFDNPYLDDPHSDQPTGLKAAVPTCAVYDLLTQWEHDQLDRPTDQITELYLGGTPMNLRPTYYEASPLYHASAQNAAGTNWLIVWATHDDVVDPSQSTTFTTHLKRTGANVRTVPLVGASHFWMREAPLTSPGSNPALFAPRLLTFLGEYL